VHDISGAKMLCPGGWSRAKRVLIIMGNRLCLFRDPVLCFFTHTNIIRKASKLQWKMLSNIKERGRDGGTRSMRAWFVFSVYCRPAFERVNF